MNGKVKFYLTYDIFNCAKINSKQLKYNMLRFLKKQIYQYIERHVVWINSIYDEFIEKNG